MSTKNDSIQMIHDRTLVLFLQLSISPTLDMYTLWKFEIV